MTIWSPLMDCTRCIVLAAGADGGVPQSSSLDSARMHSVSLCQYQSHACYEPIANVCDEQSTICQWTVPPRPPPPFPSPPPQPPASPLVHLVTSITREIATYHINNGSTASISEYVALQDDKEGANSRSIIFYAVLSAIATFALISLWTITLSFLTSIHEQWKLWRRVRAVRLTTDDSRESTASVSSYRTCVLLLCRGCAMFSACLLMTAPHSSRTRWEANMRNGGVETDLSSAGAEPQQEKEADDMSDGMDDIEMVDEAASKNEGANIAVAKGGARPYDIRIDI